MYVVVDVETGGFNAQLHSLLSLSLMVIHEESIHDPPINQMIAEWRVKLFYVNEPQYVVTSQAMEVNQLNLSYLKEHGMSLKELDAHLHSMLSTGSTIVWIGHNVPFDWGFIRANLPLTAQLPSTLLDTKELAKIAFPGQPSYSLQNLASALELGSFGQAHSADADVLTCYQLLRECQTQIAGRSKA